MGLRQTDQVSQRPGNDIVVAGQKAFPCTTGSQYAGDIAGDRWFFGHHGRSALSQRKISGFLGGGGTFFPFRAFRVHGNSMYFRTVSHIKRKAVDFFPSGGY